jgi:hypothetical protein
MTAPPSAAVMTGPRPSAAVPSRTINRPQTIRFTNPTFSQSRTKRFSSATTVKPSVKSAKRADSLVPPKPSTSTQEKPRRKSTAASLFQSRSWSIFWDPRMRTTTREDASDNIVSVQDPESCNNSAGQGGKCRSFIARCKQDKLLHVVLGMVILTGGALIIAGVVWTVTHQSRVMKDSRNFACGKGIAGGPKCSVQLKGEKSSVGSAEWVGSEVVDWWLKNHCTWQGKEGEWWCGSQIGQGSKGDQVLPQGTWFEKAEEGEEEADARRL